MRKEKKLKKIKTKKKKVKGENVSQPVILYGSPGLNSGQKLTLKAVIRKRKKNHQSCNQQNHQTLRL